MFLSITVVGNMTGVEKITKLHITRYFQVEFFKNFVETAYRVKTKETEGWDKCLYLFRPVL